MTEVGLEPGSLSSDRTAKLVTRGRRSGLPHVVVVRFAYDRGAFVVLAGKTESDWVLNARAAGRLKLRLREYSCDASVTVEKDKARALELFSGKYGASFTTSWYSGAEVCLRLVPVSGFTRRGGVKGEGEAGTDLATWKRQNANYYGGVASAFDSASDEYDHTIRNNFINGWIRKRSIRELLRLTNPRDVLLEVGCGTGAEALEISRHVSGIVATDISPGMIDLLNRKLEARRMTGVAPLLLPASRISRAGPHLPNGRTRVAYSFNGALNCEPEIARFPDELCEVLEDGGFFVCSVRNSFCLSESLVHGLVLQLDKLAPRKKQPVMVSVGGTDIPSYYYRPDEFARFFSRRFTLRRMVGLPSILPPAYLSDVYFRARKVLSFAERAEEAMAGRFPLNRFGDQTLFVFQKS